MRTIVAIIAIIGAVLAVGLACGIIVVNGNQLDPLNRVVVLLIAAAYLRFSILFVHGG